MLTQSFAVGEGEGGNVSVVLSNTGARGSKGNKDRGVFLKHKLGFAFVFFFFSLIFGGIILSFLYD
jgi:hypothetical protein